MGRIPCPRPTRTRTTLAQLPPLPFSPHLLGPLMSSEPAHSIPRGPSVRDRILATVVGPCCHSPTSLHNPVNRLAGGPRELWRFLAWFVATEPGGAAGDLGPTLPVTASFSARTLPLSSGINTGHDSSASSHRSRGQPHQRHSEQEGEDEGFRRHGTRTGTNDGASVLSQGLHHVAGRVLWSLLAELAVVDSRIAH
jgi:hypothetical protein